ncbi:UPF0389 protein CG9231-like isoform X1 [Dinothrombium tinctorium]|uniref:UPF0389 protein CG9231-like isoform X1 n=1 Tax=Dinothrombium tinctorium TaxID=1965070 RepID=A0A3S3PPH4_9ACAR|nr:UPF0389 protein CG9231-like isoform X1 [Dinothrombium tinctorium]
MDKMRHLSPRPFERRLLVWFGRYKSLEEIPTLVPFGMMGYSAYSGKKAAESGDTLLRRNVEFHRQYKEMQAEKQPNSSK